MIDPQQKPVDIPDPAAARELFAFDQKIVGEMTRAGVGVLAGTDSMNPYVFPAFSLHDELALLVDADCYRSPRCRPPRPIFRSFFNDFASERSLSVFPRK